MTEETTPEPGAWLELRKEPPPDEWKPHPQCADVTTLYRRRRLWCGECAAFLEEEDGCDHGTPMILEDTARVGGDGRQGSMFMVEVTADPRTNPLEAVASFTGATVLDGAVLQLWYVTGNSFPDTLKLHQVNAVQPSPADMRLALSLQNPPAARPRLELGEGGGRG